jgi:hypothetical protein
MRDELTYLSVGYFGCATTSVTCTGATEREATTRSWYTDASMDPIVATSPSRTGVLPYFTVDLNMQVAIHVEYRDGLTLPYTESIAYNAARFDSAGPAIGGATLDGAVFIDYMPTLDLPLAGAAINAEARHVDDALHHPERTFPSVIGKHPPASTSRRSGTTNGPCTAS